MFNVGKKIRELRKIYKISSLELSKMINISQPQLSRLENGHNLAQIDTIYKICEVFNISLSEFFSSDSSDIQIKAELKNLLDSVTSLSTEQLELLTKFIKTFDKEK